MDSRWLGPAKIVAREGEDSYVIEIKPEHLMKSHRTFLKPHFEDVYSGQPVPLFYHRRTVLEDQIEPDEFIVEKIIGHRRKPDGTEEFLTHWRGYPREEATWEPPNHFFHRYSADFVDYCQQNGLNPPILRYLRNRPHAE